jgi:secondary thiamine-phosphate synthase enzyme
MNFLQKQIRLNTNQEIELINITNLIKEIVKDNDIDNALINISTKHTTSSIIINEDEEGLKQDIINFYDEIVPNNNYLHDRIDNNARSHLKSLISNPNQTIPISNGMLGLGVWQSIFFLELDGPRNGRTINITILY